MKNRNLLPLLAAVATLTGCGTTDSKVTNTQQLGPAIGHAIGTAAGAVGSNVVGLGVGAAEGASAATKATFTNEHRFVRTWREEKTTDGRIIKVPVDIEVDADGRPLERTK